jgi:hypothetical protein
MQTQRCAWFVGAMLAVAALLALGGGFVHSGTAVAQSGGAPSVASIGCAAAPGNWTDCTLTLNRDVPAGGTIFVSLADQGVSVAWCWGGTVSSVASLDISPTGEYSSSSSYSSACFTDGHVTTFNCYTPCAAGSTLIVSVLGSPPSNLAQSLSVSVG